MSRLSGFLPTALALLCCMVAPAVAQEPTFSAPGSAQEPPQGATVLEHKLLRETFGKFDVVVFIDKSGSMSTADCPDGRSRWRWCYDQTRQLMNSVENVPDHKVNIVMFNDTATQYDNATIADVGRMFQANSPGGETKIAAALGEQIDQFMDRRWHTEENEKRRLLVAVITDGGIQDMENLRQTIARTTARVNDATTIRIVFIQIGNDDEGTASLRELDTGLRNHGSAYDIVDYIPFSTLQQAGLTQTLINLMTSTTDPNAIH